MKVFGGGNLLGGNGLGGYAECLAFALDNPWLHAVAIGMQDHFELKENLSAFAAWEAGHPIPENDIWIAAIARQHNLPVVSRDEHLQWVKGITVVGW